MKAFLAPRGVVHWFLAGVREQSRHSQSRRVHGDGLNWLGTPNAGVPSDLEGGSITNLSRVNLQAPLRQALGLPEALVINTPLKLE